MLYKLVDNKPVEYNFDTTKRIVLCGVPGAFTPGCTKRHLPGFASNLKELKEKNIDKIVFVAVNDAFVMDAWNKIHGHGDIDAVSDPLCLYNDSINEGVDYGPTMGKRCNRYAVLIENGVIVRKFNDPFIEGVLNEL